MRHKELHFATEALRELRLFWKGKTAEDVDKNTNYDNCRKEYELMQTLAGHLHDYQEKRDLI